MGQVIRQYRRKAHMEQQEVGKQLGCSGNAIGGWEAGRNGPSLDVIPRLCEVLGIPIYELMGIPAPEPTLPERDALSLSNLRALNDYNRRTNWSCACWRNRIRPSSGRFGNTTAVCRMWISCAPPQAPVCPHPIMLSRRRCTCAPAARRKTATSS